MGLSKESYVRFALPKRSALIATGVTVIAMAGTAVAADPTVMKGTARVGNSNRSVVVSSTRQTLYTLSGEQVGRVTALKCINQSCFAIWLPLKTTANAPLTRGAGVNGTLGKLQRVRARFYQVTLNGKPLYRFVGDSNTKGNAKGQGIRSFGGTWSVINP
jgi:predicted lipoprotein with Yx(FWY)xxD motif